MHVWCRSLPNCRLVGEDLNISKKNFHQHSAKGAVCHIDIHLLFFQKAPFWFEIFWYHSLKNIAVDLLPVLKQKPGETPSVKASAEQREALHDFLEKLKHCRFHCWRILPESEVVTLFASNRPRLAAAGGVLLRDREHRQQPMAGACWKTGTWFLKFSIWTSPSSQVSVPEVFKFLSCNWRTWYSGDVFLILSHDCQVQTAASVLFFSREGNSTQSC